MSPHPSDRNLDLWLIDKDAEGVLKPGPGVVYDRAGLGIVFMDCLLYTSPSPRDGLLSRMPSSA